MTGALAIRLTESFNFEVEQGASGDQRQER